MVQIGRYATCETPKRLWPSFRAVCPERSPTGEPDDRKRSSPVRRGAAETEPYGHRADRLPYLRSELNVTLSSSLSVTLHALASTLAGPLSYQPKSAETKGVLRPTVVVGVDPIGPISINPRLPVSGRLGAADESPVKREQHRLETGVPDATDGQMAHRSDRRAPMQDRISAVLFGSQFAG